MFESLSERIRHDDALETTRTQRIVEGVVIFLLSVGLFIALVVVIRMVA